MAWVLARVLARAGLPPVMGEVLAGVVLGASLLGQLPGDPSAALFTPDARAVLTALGQIAAVAYLFTVGAELRARAPRPEGRAVAAVAVASFAVPWLAGLGLAVAIHDGGAPLVPFMLFVGTALAVTAFPVLARIVDAHGLRRRPAGRIALAAAAAQEVLVWPLLAVAVALATDDGSSVIGVVAAGAGALLGVLVLCRVLVPALARRWPARAGPFALAGLALAAAGTEVAGLHLVVGAVFYGAALRDPARRAAVDLLRTRPARTAGAILLPLFFALPALQVDVGGLGREGFGLLALVLVVAVAAKVLSATGAALAAGVGRADALTVGALMNARGLVELVVLTVGLQAGLIDERLFSVMVLMALITTLAAGPLVERIGRAGRRAGAVTAEPAFGRTS